MSSQETGIVQNSQRPSRKNIEWTSAILSFLFLLGVYLLSGQDSNARDIAESYSSEMTLLAEDAIFTEELYNDGLSRVVYFQGKTIEAVMSEVDESIAIKRVYLEALKGVVLVEGDENAPRIQEILATLRKTE